MAHYLLHHLFQVVQKFLGSGSRRFTKDWHSGCFSDFDTAWVHTLGAFYSLSFLLLSLSPFSFFFSLDYFPNLFTLPISGSLSELTVLCLVTVALAVLLLLSFPFFTSILYVFKYRGNGERDFPAFLEGSLGQWQ